MAARVISRPTVLHCHGCADDVRVIFVARLDQFHCDVCDDPIVCDSCGEPWADDHDLEAL